MEILSSLQTSFVNGLEGVCDDVQFEKTSWLRDEGRHGGGSRYSTGDNDYFDRASVNVSQIHYDDLPDKKLDSATALSTIIHPRHPRAPSMHMHISWTEMKDEVAESGRGRGYWRMMADLNPSIENSDDTEAFRECLKNVAPSQYDEASAQGDRYFYIPALVRHRGVAHFYLENYRSDDAQADMDLAKAMGSAVIDCYLGILRQRITSDEVSDIDAAVQLAYHSLYFFQVLTLDRGTTSGLLVHDQNDVGIMGSLPSHVDKSLLLSWRERLPAPQGALLDRILMALPDGETSLVDTGVKIAVAGAVREHYQLHPEALQLQATGDVIPPTVENHR